MRTTRAAAALIGALLSGACAPTTAAPTPTTTGAPTVSATSTASPVATPTLASVTPTPTSSAIPTAAPFYTQVTDIGGFAVKGSAKVRPEAVSAAATAFGLLVFGNAAIVNRLRDAHVYAVVLAESEALTDLPEYARFRGQTLPDGRPYDGMRAIGPIPCVAGEENLLHLEGDTFGGATILIHECAHAIYLYGLDAGQQGRWNAIYAGSLAAGLWQNTYAATNPTEFFAELTESYFGVNASPEAGVHNDVNGQARLKAYDPRAFAFLDAVYTPNGTP